mmetsp:Transcript_51875/g.105472  ORF Transcript_51875/g.105472 Transcript_51875/m.105472 type:complete len:200 (+) Transcript_51875:52-651(+)
MAHPRSEGFGIAGHRNTYKTGVHCGNWVEDKAGMDRVRSGQHNPSHFQSEAQANFIQPKKMDDKAVRMCPPTTFTDAAGGMPAHLLFSHGMAPHDPKQGEEFRMASMSMAMYGETKMNSAEVLSEHPSERTLRALESKSNERSKEARKNAAREAKMGTQMVTEASATMRKGAKAPRPVGNDRNTTFTREYNKGIPGLRR